MFVCEAYDAGLCVNDGALEKLSPCHIVFSLRDVLLADVQGGGLGATPMFSLIHFVTVGREVFLVPMVFGQRDRSMSTL